MLDTPFEKGVASGIIIIGILFVVLLLIACLGIQESKRDQTDESFNQPDKNANFKSVTSSNINCRDNLTTTKGNVTNTLLTNNVDTKSITIHKELINQQTIESNKTTIKQLHSSSNLVNTNDLKTDTAISNFLLTNECKSSQNILCRNVYPIVGCMYNITDSISVSSTTPVSIIPSQLAAIGDIRLFQPIKMGTSINLYVLSDVNAISIPDFTLEFWIFLEDEKKETIIPLQTYTTPIMVNPSNSIVELSSQFTIQSDLKWETQIQSIYNGLSTPITYDTLTLDLDPEQSYYRFHCVVTNSTVGTTSIKSAKLTIEFM